MARYKIWDKKEDIYTLGRDKNGKAHWTAQEYIDEKAPWAGNPGAKVIVGGGAINGTVFMEFEATKEHYARLGADFSACETDADVLAAIEAFENTPAEVAPSAEERIAAALEYQNLLNM
jgi:hypothetical protein